MPDGNLIIKPPPVRVAAMPHPFRLDTVNAELPEGLTLAEILESVQPDEVLRRKACIFIDDWMVPRGHWHVTRPNAGRLVTIRAVPEGGGVSPLRIVAAIAIIAAAAAFGPALGTALVGAEGLTIAGATVSATAIGQAVIATAGGLLLTLIAPVKPPKAIQNEADSPSYFSDAT